jgi:hypothetical protein
VHCGCACDSAGPTPANPSNIKDCAFRGFWKVGPTGIGILFGNDINNWRIEGSRFINTKQPIYYNRVNGLTIVGNTFKK